MSVTSWLLEGNRRSRWQVRRDLQDAPVDVVAVKRMWIAAEG